MKKIVIGAVLLIGGILLSFSMFATHIPGFATSIILGVIGIFVLLIELCAAYADGEKDDKEEPNSK